MSMNHRTNVRIVGFVGMPGAGKTEAVNHVVEKGYPRIYFGGILYDEMRAENIPITPESQAVFRVEWRKREGKDVIVKRAIERINNLVEAGQNRIVVDGIMSWDEFKIMKHEFPGELTVVAVIAPRHVRHQRLANRTERPFTKQESSDRDWAEIENLLKGGPIAMADFAVINDQNLDKLHESTDEILREINFES